jgi:Family of unknown function (DUF6655)
MAFLGTGCATYNQTSPPRSATEQLLLSTATDRALRSADLSVFAHRKVYLDPTYFDSYDSKYVLGTIRDALSRAGAILADNAADSDIIMEARSGALSIDDSDTLFGIPRMGMPVPLAGALQTPELAFYKVDRQRSTAKFALLAFAKSSREHIYSSGPLDGGSYDKHYRLLFIAWIRSDIPEKHGKKAAQPYETWFPQYDLKNLPPAAAQTNLLPTPAVPTPAPTMTHTNAAGM